MTRDEQDQMTGEGPKRGASGSLVRGVTLALFALGAVATCGLVMARLQQPLDVKPVSSSGVEKGMPKDLKEMAAKHFRNWPAGRTPDLVIALTGETHNYEAPCGCSFPQSGGLERRYNFLKFLRDQGLDVVAADLGDVYFNEYVQGRPTLQKQLDLKYARIMEALNLMNYSAVGVGAQEFRLGLLDALGATVLDKKNRFRVLAANLKDRDNNYPDGTGGSMVGDWVPAGKSVKVAFAGIVGKSVEAQVQTIDKNIQFDGNVKVVKDLEVAMTAGKSDVRVMLYQGKEDDAKKLAEAFPGFNAVLCLSPQSDPPGQAQMVGKTLVLQVGHKGRFIGVVGVFRKEGGWDLRYDLVKLDPEFETPKADRAKNAMNQLLEKYTEEVRDKKMIGLYAQVDHPLQVTFAKLKPVYVGSDKCQKCHANEYNVWSASKHAEAFEALDDKNLTQAPSNRKTDGECVVCHTTGFGYKTGYSDEKVTAHLKGVGCENCHGPGGAHVADPQNKALNLAMSPWKQKPGDALPNAQVEIRIDVNLCAKCHDTDNDPKFKFDFWRKIAHGPNEKATKKHYTDEFKKRTE